MSAVVPVSLSSQPLPAVFSPTLFVTALLPFCAGYFMSFYFRTVNALFAGQLSAELSLGAAELGLLTSAYFGTAALMQLPVGFALDRFGPRKVQIVSLAIAAGGAAVFAIAQSFWPLFLGRALIGVGVAAALVSAIKVAALRFPAERAGLLNGVIIASGAAGAVVASAPSEILLTQMTWRDMYLGIAAVTAGVWLLHVTIVPRDAPSAAPVAGASGFGAVVRDRRFWRFAPMAACVVGTAWAYHGLWLAIWLADAAHMPPAHVVQLLLLTAITFGAGALGYGVLLELLRRLGIGPAPVMVVVALLVVATELTMAIFPSLPGAVPAALLGVISAATVLSFTTLRGLFDVALVGRANGLLNTMNFGMAFAIQSGFGVVVALGGRDAEGHFAPSAFAPALLTCAVLKLLAVLWYLAAPSAASNPKQGRTWRRLGYAATIPLLVFAGVHLAPSEQVSAMQQLGTSILPTMRQTLAAQDPVAPTARAPQQRAAQSDALLDTVRRLEAELKSAAAREERVIGSLMALKSESESGRQQLSAVGLRLASVEQALAERAQPMSPAPVVGSVAPPGPVPHMPSSTPSPCQLSELGQTSGVITFGRDQSTVDLRNVTGIDPLLDVLRRCGGVRLLIEGFADPRGSQSANRALSRRRAEKVAAFLGERGIEPGRIVVAEASADDRRLKSRRVDLSLILDSGAQAGQ
jgi:outer membrane protein OmpA-like peptidoglycan-associated protein/MFS family permease